MPIIASIFRSSIARKAASIAVVTTTIVGLAVFGGIIKITDTGESADRNIACWRTSSGSGICVRETGAIIASGSITAGGIMSGNTLVVSDGSVNIDGVSYTFPSAVGGANTVLTDAAGNGTLSWTSAGGGSSTYIGSVTAASTGTGASDVNENTMIPTWTGTGTIIADSLAAGDTLKIRISGLYRLDAGNLTVRIKVGGQLMYVAPNTHFQADSAQRVYDIDTYINVRSIGGTGKIYPAGTVSVDDLLTGNIQATTERTVDTTSDMLVVVTAQFDNSQAAHTATIQAGLIEIVNAT